MLAQVDRAIEIFEEAHPDCVALFIFDQSLAHASLGPDALHAFNINNPCAEFCGKLSWTALSNSFLPFSYLILGRPSLAYLTYLWTVLAFSRDFHTIP